MAVRHHFPKAAIDAVDIDAEALDLGQCFFDAKEDSHLMMHNEDGVKFLTRQGVSSQVNTFVTTNCNKRINEALSFEKLACDVAHTYGLVSSFHHHCMQGMLAVPSTS